MNRIYQGKVTNGEIANKDKNAPLEQCWLSFEHNLKLAKAKWREALWQHHRLFLDTLN